MASGFAVCVSGSDSDSWCDYFVSVHVDSWEVTEAVIVIDGDVVVCM